MQKYKLAIIGATGTAYKRMIPALKDSTLCKVVAIQGRDIEKLRRIGAEYQINHAFTDVSEMLKQVECDFVYIANPPFLHFDSIEKALAFKKPILCEKPLAQNLLEAEKIQQELVKNQKVPFAIAHHLRHQPAIADIKSLMEANAIGSVISVIAQWGFKLKPEDKNTQWKIKPELGGNGTLTEQGIHLVDLFLYLFGQPEMVIGHSFSKAFPTILDNESILFAYKDKTLFANCSQTMPLSGNHLLIYGDKGKIEAFGGIGVTNIKKLVLTTPQIEKVYEYSGNDNCYRQEIEDFISQHFLKDSSATNGTTLAEAMQALRLIENMRNSN